MAKVRRKVLKEFTRNTPYGIVVGHPEHPDEDGRFVVVEQEVADMLAGEGLIGDEDTAEKMPKPSDEVKTRTPAADALKGALTQALKEAGKEESTADARAQSADQRAEDNSIAGLIREGEGKGVGGGDTGGGDNNPDGADGNVGGTRRNSSQAVREAQAAGKPSPADQKRTGRGQRGGKTEKTKAAAGGDQTNATTSHPAESGPNTPPEQIPGNQPPPADDADPDAAPTGGGATS